MASYKFGWDEGRDEFEEGKVPPFGSSGYALLPGSLPETGEWIESVGGVAAAADYFPMNSGEMHAVAWTISLENAFTRSAIARMIPGFQMATYGFANAEVEVDAFGVIVYTAPSFQAESGERPATIMAAGVEFPIIYRAATWQAHGMPVNPAKGTATCWARSRKSGMTKKTALVTAKHVVGAVPLGSTIALSTGSGTLLDVAPEGIDAALIQVARSQRPATWTPLTCPRFVAQWTDVEVDGATSGRFATKITEVSSGRGTLDASVPLRVFLANSGQGGDSGALVLDDMGRGIGLYMGAVTTPANVREGFCQHLGQVEYTLGVDLFT